MVALNYQAQDKPLAFNRALFKANGKSGYILKPEPLLNGMFIFNKKNLPLDFTKDIRTLIRTRIVL